MRKFLSMRRFFRSENGQIFLWLALGVPLLILMSALALDMGMIYRTKARLGNGVDSAVLTAAKNYTLGTATAEALGNDMFYANFGTACNTGSVSCTWTFCPADIASCPANSAITATLNATVPWQTTFMAYLPQWRTWTLGDVGQATRSTLIMMLVLDRSGSMGSPSNGGDGGLTALQAAVPEFLEFFTPGTDYIGLVSFGSHSSIDVAISTSWGPWNSGTIYNAVQAYQANGGTFGGGAGSGTLYSNTNGPPLNMADAQNNSVSLATGVPEVKVVVYFTDGLMNTLQDEFTCGGVPNTLVNYGGYDPTNPGESSPYVPEAVAGLNPLAEIPSGSPVYCYDPTTDPDYPYCGANYVNSTQLVTYQNATCTYNGAKAVFPSEEHTPTEALNRWNVTNEVKYRTKITANNMRAESPVPTYIFTIGLSSAVTNDPCTAAFLATLANDPSAGTYLGGSNCDSGNGVYNSSLPAGLFVEVPDCPGAQCTAELEAAFIQIADKVLLRLSE